MIDYTQLAGGLPTTTLITIVTVLAGILILIILVTVYVKFRNRNKNLVNYFLVVKNT